MTLTPSFSAVLKGLRVGSEVGTMVSAARGASGIGALVGAVLGAAVLTKTDQPLLVHCTSTEIWFIVCLQDCHKGTKADCAQYSSRVDRSVVKSATTQEGIGTPLSHPKERHVVM